MTGSSLHKQIQSSQPGDRGGHDRFLRARQVVVLHAGVLGLLMASTVNSEGFREARGRDIADLAGPVRFITIPSR
jgi:hypothetical protein